MYSNKEVKRLFNKQQLKVMLNDVGLTVYRLEQELGVNEGTISVIYKSAESSKKREVPVKYEQPILEIIKRFKAGNVDKSIVAKEVLRDSGIEVAESQIPSHLTPEIITQRKNWIAKLREAKLGLNN